MSKFELKQKVDDTLFKIYNCLSDLQFQFKRKEKLIVAENKKYQHIHAKEECFILGTGPSLLNLTDDQISHISKEKTFAVNSLYKSKAGKSISPTYYALMDNNYWEDESYKRNVSEIAEQYSDNPPTFITDFRAAHIFDNVVKSRKNIYLHAKKYPVSPLSFDLHENTFGLMNVVSVCIATAIYMGFTKIYLLGCDYNAFCSFGGGHCYDDEEELKGVSYNLAFYLKYYHLTTEFHYLIAKYAKENNIKIVNLSSTSLLDAYPRRNIESLIF